MTWSDQIHLALTSWEPDWLNDAFLDLDYSDPTNQAARDYEEALVARGSASRPQGMPDDVAQAIEEAALMRRSGEIRS